MLSTLAGALVAGLTITGPVPALDPGDGLAVIQQRAERATENRIHAIDNALWRVERTTSLTDGHRATIVATLEADQAALEALQNEIAADTEAAEALADYQRIFTDYRVYAVALPQALYAAGADRLTETALPRLEEAYAALAERAEGEPEAADELADMREAIDAATQAANGLADAALAVTPANYNEDATALAELRLDLRQATASARDALHSARAAVQELR